MKRQQQILPDDIVIVAAKRSAIGKFGGSLRNMAAIELASSVIIDTLQSYGIATDNVDEVIVGNVGGWGANGFLARAAALSAQLPVTSTAYSVNRQCGSSLQAVINGVQSLLLNRSKLVLAGGVESISTLPFYNCSLRWGSKMGNVQLRDGVMDILTWPLDMSHNGITAENVARKFKITREQQDEYALLSQKRAANAVKDNIFNKEITPIEIKDKRGQFSIFEKDEGPRVDVSMAKLAALKPCFMHDDAATVTAGNSSSLNDGSAFLALTKRSVARSMGLATLATIRDWAIAGCDPAIMGYAPFYSTQKLCQQINLSPSCIDMIEINEAFAAQVIAVQHDLKVPIDKLNIYGGGISLGHPLGATGAILLTKCVHELQRSDKEDAMISMCIGGGQGISLYITKE